MQLWDLIMNKCGLDLDNNNYYYYNDNTWIINFIYLGYNYFFAGAMSLINTPSNMTAAKNAQRQVGTII